MMAGGVGVPRVRIEACTVDQIPPIYTGLLGDWLADQSVQVVDIRPPQQFTDAHIPGSVSIPLCRRWAEWCKALLPPDRPVVLIAHDPRDLDHVSALAGSIEDLRFAGYLDAAGCPGTAMDAWICQGGDYDELPTLRISQVRQRLASCCATHPMSPALLDVRDAREREAARIEPSTHAPLGSLLEAVRDLPRQAPLATLCRSGVRSVIAASVMRRMGFETVMPVELGMDRWCGQHPDDQWLCMGNA